MNRPRSDLTRDELALAYELRQEGCCWKRIAMGLNCDAIDIKEAVGHACRFGLPDKRRTHSAGGRTPGFTPEQIQAAMLMRWHGLGWGCIARYFATDRAKLRKATRYLS